ncbi:hypothetical protein O181_023940 [Austropuccinia psidii MF-1]|uniref:Uncharacterized protein n=1 Tax=Austropuccinia psidii MF-1 TaxID=1389203 RepID=A0A9Q3GZK8_9BASI|nr:hypothetical protein [Austropuccinia psidii MF-1]
MLLPQTELGFGTSIYRKGQAHRTCKIGYSVRRILKASIPQAIWLLLVPTTLKPNTALVDNLTLHFSLTSIILALKTFPLHHHSYRRLPFSIFIASRFENSQDLD